MHSDVVVCQSFEYYHAEGGFCGCLCCVLRPRVKYGVYVCVCVCVILYARLRRCVLLGGVIKFKYLAVL